MAQQVPDEDALADESEVVLSEQGPQPREVDLVEQVDRKEQSMGMTFDRVGIGGWDGASEEGAEFEEYGFEASFENMADTERQVAEALGVPNRLADLRNLCECKLGPKEGESTDECKNLREGKLKGFDGIERLSAVV